MASITSRPSTAAPILAVLAVVLMTLGAYVGGYFLSGTAIARYAKDRDSPESFRSQLPGTRIVRLVRYYPNRWLAIIFVPAGVIEGGLRGMHVVVDSIESDGQEVP